MITDQELAEVEALYQQSCRETERLRLRRNATFRAASAAGRTYERIAKATGLSRGRIGQIVGPKPEFLSRLGGKEPVLVHRPGRRHKPG